MWKKNKHYEEKYEIAEIFYDLFHKDGLPCSEASGKKTYCEMMAKTIGISELEQMRDVSVKAAIKCECCITEESAIKLYNLIGLLLDKCYDDEAC